MMPVASEPRPELRCVRCRTRLAPDQDWCLGCGAAATTRVLGPPSWKLAAATVLGVVAVVAVGVVLLVTSLSSSSNRTVARRAASAPVPAPSASPPPPAAAPAAPATGTATTPPRTATSTTPAVPLGGGGVQTWRAGKRGWTVVLGTEVEQSAARARAQGYIAKGVKAGVLDATRYTFSTPTGAFVIFFGQFDTQSAAVTAESGIADKLPATAYVTSVTPR